MWHRSEPVEAEPPGSLRFPSGEMPWGWVVLGATAQLGTAGWNALRNSFGFHLLLKVIFPP